MYIIISIIAIALDQITKYMAYNNLQGKDVIVFDNLLHLTYVENRGAAWGILQDSRLFFIIVTLFVLSIISYFVLKYRNKLDSFTKLTLAMIVSGAIGNFIDRLFFGYVIDFIFTPLGGLYDFPVFNLADIYISLSCFFIIIYLLFIEGKKDDNK